MRTQFLLALVVTLISIAAIGCGGAAPTNAPANANANTAKTNSNNPLETTKAPVEATKNNAPTLTPLIKAYCEAKMKNDEAGIRAVYSADTLKSFEEQMKEEKVKSLVKFLESDKVSDKLCKAENEKITGDSAVAKVFIDSYPTGLDVYFVNENGSWKMTNRSPTFESVKQSNSNTNK